MAVEMLQVVSEPNLDKSGVIGSHLRGNGFR